LGRNNPTSKLRDVKPNHWPGLIKKKKKVSIKRKNIRTCIGNDVEKLESRTLLVGM